MFWKMLLPSFWFAVLVMGGAHPCSARVNPEGEIPVVIAIYNDAQVPPEVLEIAEETGGAIFAKAGLRAEWLHCRVPGETEEQSRLCSHAEFPAHLQVHIARRSADLKASIFGIAYLADDGTGCYSDVFYARVVKLAREQNAGVGPILGHVMVHEIAHLLLGRHSHSSTGIMRGLWAPEELARLQKGMLLFTSEQSATMRRRLAAAANVEPPDVLAKAAVAD